MGLFGNSDKKGRVELLDNLDISVAEKIMIEQNETIIGYLAQIMVGQGSLIGGGIAATMRDLHHKKLSKWIKEK